VRWLRRVQAGKLCIRSRQLTAQRCYYRVELVFYLGKHFALERGKALLKFGAQAREVCVVVRFVLGAQLRAQSVVFLDDRRALMRAPSSVRGLIRADQRAQPAQKLQPNLRCAACSCLRRR